ncbi:MAG: hypothetical protein KDJ52_09415 [Anaerolineae bacterium]|nr:hypothetical protein [Anaerolineae bacterium]
MSHTTFSFKPIGLALALTTAMVVTAACGGATPPETAKVEPTATELPTATPTTEQGAQMEATAGTVEETDTAKVEPKAEETTVATAEASDQTDMSPADEKEWVVAKVDTWIPVVDELGQKLQAARRSFEAGDVDTAATMIREGAAFLDSEAAAVTSEDDKTALKEAAKTQLDLATKLEKGQITSIEALDEAIAEAHQVDVAHRLINAKEETLFPLVEKLAQHFQYAVDALNKESYSTAAAEIRQAVAYLKIDEARANGQVKDALQALVGELNGVADDVAQGKITSAADLEMTFAQAHYVLAAHYQLAATNSQNRDALRDAGFELKAAATNLEQTLFHVGQKAEGDDALFITNLRNLGDDLIAGKDVKGIFEELEARQAQAAPAAAPEDEWVVAEENIWIPVVDEFGQHLQASHQSFEADDMIAAAKEIRAGATFLNDEAAQATDTADATALKDAAKSLDDLAAKVAEGQVTSIEALNVVFQEAYQTDVANHLRLVKEEALYPLVEKPTQHFQQAITALNEGDTAAAAREIHKAVAYLHLSEARAVGPAKAALQASIGELTNLADAIANGEIASPDEMDALTFAQAHYALALHHQLAAMGAEDLGEMKDAGYELKAAASHLEQTLSRAGREANEDETAFIENLRNLGDDLIAGKQTKSIVEELQQRQGSSTTEVEPQSQTAPLPKEELWISFTEEDIWVPVMDEFGQELLTARNEFLDGNSKASATAMQQAAQFLQQEELGPDSTPEDVDARLEAADQLVKLADEVEQGQVTDIAQLNPAFIKAYQVNIDHRLASLPANERLALIDQATGHFHNAVEAYTQDENDVAAVEIRKGVAYLRLDQALSNESAQEALQTPIDQLNSLADEAAQGNISLTELEKGIADSQSGLATAYQQQAAERLTEDNNASGYALKASLHNLKEALALSGQEVEADTTTFFNDVNSLADKLVAGTEYDADHMGQMIEKLGQEIDNFARVKSTDKAKP